PSVWRLRFCATAHKTDQGTLINMSTLRLSDDKKAIARQTARMMLEINAIHFNAEHPFVFTSGWASPVYVDCRKLISYPRLRSALMDLAAHTIATEIGYESIDVIT